MKQLKQTIIDATKSFDGTVLEKLISPVEIKEKSRYKLAELIAQCDPNSPKNPTIAEWENIQPVGKEVL